MFLLPDQLATSPRACLHLPRVPSCRPPSPDMFQQVLVPLFFLSPPRLPSALLSPPSTCFLLISAFREAGGWEKSPRFWTRKFKFRGDKICPRSQRWCQESNWLSLTPAQASLHCCSCTVLPLTTHPAHTGAHTHPTLSHSLPLCSTTQPPGEATTTTRSPGAGGLPAG